MDCLRPCPAFVAKLGVWGLLAEWACRPTPEAKPGSGEEAAELPLLLLLSPPQPRPRPPQRNPRVLLLPRGRTSVNSSAPGLSLCSQRVPCAEDWRVWRCVQWCSFCLLLRLSISYMMTGNCCSFSLVKWTWHISAICFLMHTRSPHV